MSHERDAGSRVTELTLQQRLLTLLVIVQAGWLAYLCRRGWFYQEDLTYLSQAAHQRLTGAYLIEPVNHHPAPGVRFIFWILSRSYRLSYDPTILLRVVLQGAATVLLFRLLGKVSSSRWLALAMTALYCASPLLIPGMMSLAASTQVLPAQICVILAYDLRIRHAESGGTRYALACGLALLVGVVFWEKTIETAVLLVIVSLGWLSDGGLRRRVWALIRDWWGWLLMLAPPAAFTVYYLRHSPSHTHSASAQTVVNLVWLQWSRTLWPAVIGAPWHWASGGSTYTSTSDPRLLTIVVGQVAFVALVVVGWRRSRWRGLVAWLLPFAAVVMGEVLVGTGQVGAFGEFSATEFRYSFDLAVPTALAVALAFRRPPAPQTNASELTTSDLVLPRLGRQLALRPVAAVVGVALIVASSVITATLWTNRWHKSPTKDYVRSVVTNTVLLGPYANLFDTEISPTLRPFISPHGRLSDLLAVSNIHPFFDVGIPQPRLLDASGQLVTAQFRTLASYQSRPKPLCASLLSSKTSVTVPLKPAIAAGSYFLRVDYYESGPAFVHITVRDAAGHQIAAASDAEIYFGQALGAVYLPLTYGAARQVTFTTTDAGPSLCMATVRVGVPVAAAP
jgi:hypothetical protein